MRHSRRIHTEIVEPLILTARLEHGSLTYFEQLRQQHFPPERNFVPAHVTLFHALPGGNRGAITSQLREMTRRETPMEGGAYKLQFLGKGVAFAVDCARLFSLRAALAEIWSGDLTPQDSQKPHFHITVQNKVSPVEARALLDALQGDFKPRPLVFIGLDLWRYMGGPWSFVEGFSFYGGEQTETRGEAD